MKNSFCKKLMYLSLIVFTYSCIRQPIATIINLKGVNKIKFIAINDNKSKMVKREITDINEINRFLGSFYSKNAHRKSNIAVNKFNKNAEIDITFTNKSDILIIELDTNIGYRITIDKNVYYEEFTWYTGVYIGESLNNEE
jgi:hypothetical protein